MYIHRIRIIAAFLCLAVILSCSALAYGGLYNFTDINEYTPGQFSDVKSGSWYEPSVAKAYSLGLINGKSSTVFDPDSNLSYAEAIKLAACLNSIYYNGNADFPSDSPWYQPYVDYCLENGIMQSEYRSYTSMITRADFVVLFSRSMPESTLEPINEYKDGDIPDVTLSHTYGEAAYMLYRAGILTGSDSKGTFNADNLIMRNEVSALVTRMAVPSLRIQNTTPSTPDPVEEMDDEALALESLELLNSLRPYIADCSIVNPTANAPALKLIKTIKRNSKQLINSGDAGYSELGDILEQSALLAEGFVGKSTEYVSSTGLLLWSSCVSDYIDMLANLVDVSG